MISKVVYTYNNTLNFVNYDKSLLDDCLELFDSNTPQFFAKNERADYKKFLDNNPDNYKVGFLNEEVVAVFGISIDSQRTRGRITWIMVNPHSKGGGVGTKMMKYVKEFST